MNTPIYQDAFKKDKGIYMKCVSRFLIEEMTTKHAELDGFSESYGAHRHGSRIRLNPESSLESSGTRCGC